MFVLYVISLMTSFVNGCNEPLDLVFLVDGSNSVSSSDFIQEKAFVSSQTMEYFVSPDRVRIAVMLYSDVVWETIDFKESVNDELFVKRVSSLTQNLGDLFINKALKRAGDLFKTDGRPGTRRVVVLIATGRSSRLWEAFREARKLRQDHTSLYAIGVGGGVSSNELMGLTSDRNNVLLVDTFNTLFSLSSKLHEIICPGYKQGHQPMPSQAYINLLKPQIELSIISHNDNKGLSPFLPQRTDLISKTNRNPNIIQNNDSSKHAATANNTEKDLNKNNQNIRKDSIVLKPFTIANNLKISDKKRFNQGNIIRKYIKTGTDEHKPQRNVFNIGMTVVNEDTGNLHPNINTRVQQKKLDNLDHVASYTTTTKTGTDVNAIQNYSHSNRRKSSKPKLRVNYKITQHIQRNITSVKNDNSLLGQKKPEYNALFEREEVPKMLKNTKTSGLISSYNPSDTFRNNGNPDSSSSIRQNSVWTVFLENAESIPVFAIPDVIPNTGNRKTPIARKEIGPLALHKNQTSVNSKPASTIFNDPPITSKLDQILFGTVDTKDTIKDPPMQDLNLNVAYTSGVHKNNNMKSGQSLVDDVTDNMHLGPFSINGVSYRSANEQNTREDKSVHPTANKKPTMKWTYPKHSSILMPTTSNELQASVTPYKTYNPPTITTRDASTTTSTKTTPSIVTKAIPIPPPIVTLAKTSLPITTVQSNTTTPVTTAKLATAETSSKQHYINSDAKSIMQFRYQGRNLDKKPNKPFSRKKFNSRKGAHFIDEKKPPSAFNKYGKTGHSKGLRKQISFLLDFLMLEHDRLLRKNKNKKVKRRKIKPDITTTAKPVVWRDIDKLQKEEKNRRFNEQNRFGKKRVPEKWNYRRPARFLPGNEIRRKLLPDPKDENDEHIISENEDCSLLPHDQDASLYIEKNDNRTVVRPCPEGTAFEMRTCACTIMTIVSGYGDCHPEIMLDFDTDKRDKSGKNVYVGSSHVDLSNGTAVFSGNSALTIWRFTGSDIGQTLFIKVRFKAVKSPHVRQYIISNCQSNIPISYGIEIDRFEEVVIFSLDTQPREVKEIKVPFKLDQWTTVSLIYDGLRLTGSVDGQRKSIPVAGDIETRSSPLLIGGCGGKTHGFSGLVDEVSVSFCIPQTRGRRLYI